jgi:hypothetical protein
LVEGAIADLELPAEMEVCRVAIREILKNQGDPRPVTVAAKAAEIDSSLSADGLFECLRACVFSAPQVANIDALKREAEQYAGMLRQLQKTDREAQAHQLLKQGGISALADATDLINNHSIPQITAFPFLWVSPEQIPTRKFLFASRHHIVGHASATGAIGGTGKSSFIVAEALAHATGRDLLNDAPLFKGRAWILGLEDAHEEHRRRITATALLHKIDPGQLEGRLFLNDASQDFIVARQTRDGLLICEPVISGIVKQIRDLGITLLCVDPFVASHAVPENDNTSVDAVARAWVQIARESGCSVDLVHHLRKGNGNGSEPSADDFRGASSLVPAVRSARLLSTMDASIGTKLEVSERFRYFRIIDAKKNMSARASDTPWCEITAIDLRNGDPSDHVAAVGPWRPPSAADITSPEDTETIKERLASGTWRENVQAKAWAGNVVAEVLGLDLADEGARDAVRQLLRQWISDGVVKVIDGKDDRRKPCKFVVPA